MDSGLRLRALFASIALGVILGVIAAILLQQFPVPAERLRDAFAIAVVVAIALATAVFHQSLRISGSAQALARHMTKEMLIYSREFFSELYRGSPVPYVVTDEHGTIESINLAAARFFNVEQNALDGQNIYSFFIEDGEGEAAEQRVHISLIPEYFRLGKYVNDAELQMRRPDGMKRWVLLSLFPATDAQGRKKGMLTLVDITKQKQVDKAKTEFVSLASHQLRTPISGMKWNIELLQMGGGLTEAQAGLVEKIKTSAFRMDTLVTDFLSVSKLDLGTLKPEYSEVPLNAFFTSVVGEYEALATQKSITIETPWPADMGTLYTDAHLLQMITSNILGNAVKYTHTGGTVRFGVASERDQIVITIADNGIGIPAEDQEQLFTKLFRASNARSQVTDGTGLGLYIVKEAVTILGGTISFVSKEGEGTTFQITFPRTRN